MRKAKDGSYILKEGRNFIGLHYPSIIIGGIVLVILPLYVIMKKFYNEVNQ